MRKIAISTRFFNSALGLLLTCILLTGCNYTSERYHPDYLEYRKQIRRVLVLHPEINIFEELDDGSMICQMDKSRDAQATAFEAVSDVLADKDYFVRPAGSETMNNDEIRSVQTLFRSVNRSIQLHTYGPQLYPAKLRDFEYEVGPVDDVLTQFEVDALVLVVGHQTLSSLRPKTWISIAVVEPGGKIIWYGMQGAKADLDLQTPTSAHSLVNETLLPFSRFGT